MECRGVLWRLMRRGSRGWGTGREDKGGKEEYTAIPLVTESCDVSFIVFIRINRATVNLFATLYLPTCIITPCVLR
jgi:hypothetical protein